MQTRRDQLQAYRFVTRRVMAALLHGEPDTPESPMRKLAVATFSGVMVAVLAVAAFGVWGLLRPGGAQSLEDPGTLIIEKETGTRYVFDTKSQRLDTVLNYASARLLLDSDTITVRRVSQRSLVKYRRGPTVGIPGAPESLPDADALVRKPWSVCTRVERRSASSDPRPFVSLIGGQHVGGSEFGDDQAVVVRVPSGAFYVIWHNERLRADSSAIVVFNIQSEPLVGATWLNALPTGPDFKPPQVTQQGSAAGFQLDGQAPVVGQVLKADIVGGDPRWYVVLPDGLAPIWETEASLLLADPRTKAAYPGRSVAPIPVDPASANAHISSRSVSNSDLPHNLPRAATLSDGEATPLCVTYPDPRHKPDEVRVTQGGDVPGGSDESDGTIALGAVTNTGAVDRVVLPPGGGALVGLVPNPDQRNQVQTYYLIAEKGPKFPFKSADLVAKLGYDTADAVPLPPNLLRLIPDGPVLDTTAARMPVQVIPRQSQPTPSLPAG